MSLHSLMRELTYDQAFKRNKRKIDGMNAEKPRQEDLLAGFF